MAIVTSKFNSWDKEIFLEVYLIGYLSVGESVVFIIKDENDKVLYSGVVDCYSFNNSNVTEGILEKYKLKKIDFLCWTHPHFDHSKGIEDLLDKYVDNKTRIILPDYITGDDKFYSYNRRVNKAFDIINSNFLGKRSDARYDVEWASTEKCLKIVNLYNFNGISKKTLTIKSISPNSAIIMSQRKNNSIKMNDFSVGLLLSIEDVNILLGSDVENKTFSSFESDVQIPRNIKYLKTPHHTSDSSDEILNFIDDCSNSIACTTVYKCSKLPCNDIIKKYKKAFYEVLCTEDLYGKNKHKYGLISVQYDLIRNTYAVKLDGNAVAI